MKQAEVKSNFNPFSDTDIYLTPIPSIYLTPIPLRILINDKRRP